MLSRGLLNPGLKAGGLILELPQVLAMQVALMGAFASAVGGLGVGLGLWVHSPLYYRGGITSSGWN